MSLANKQTNKQKIHEFYSGRLIKRMSDHKLAKFVVSVNPVKWNVVNFQKKNKKQKAEKNTNFNGWH